MVKLIADLVYNEHREAVATYRDQELVQILKNAVPVSADADPQYNTTRDLKNLMSG